MLSLLMAMALIAGTPTHTTPGTLQSDYQRCHQVHLGDRTYGYTDEECKKMEEFCEEAEREPQACYVLWFPWLNSKY